MVHQSAATQRPTARKSVSVRPIAANIQCSTKQRRVQQHGVAAMVQARGSRTMRATNTCERITPVGTAQQAPKRGLTSANARKQRSTGAAHRVKPSTHVQSLHAQVLNHPEARDATEEIMAAKGWNTLPAGQLMNRQCTLVSGG